MTRIWRRLSQASPFARRVLITMGTNALMAGLGLVTGILSARLLGPGGRGELAAIQLWSGFIGTIALFGLPEALVYYSAREPADAGRNIGSATILALLLVLPFVAAGYLLMPVFLSAQTPHVIEAGRWYLLIVPISVLLGVPPNALWGRGDFRGWNALRLVHTMVWLAVLVGASALRQTDAPRIAAIYLAVLGIAVAPVLYAVFRRVGEAFRNDMRQWKTLLRFGFASWLGVLPHLFRLRLDQLLVAALLPGPLLGLYVVSVAWSNISTPLLNGVAYVVLPQVAAQQTRERRAQALAQSSRFGVLFALSVSVVLIVLAPWGVPLLFGGEFTASIPAAVLLVVTTAISNVNFILIQGLRGLGYPVAVFGAELSAVAVMGVALALLLRPLGILGAAFGSLLGSTIAAVALLVQVRRHTALPSSALLWPSAAEFRGWQKQLGALTAPVPDRQVTELRRP